jgi:hypothetical protein
MTSLPMPSPGIQAIENLGMGGSLQKDFVLEKAWGLSVVTFSDWHERLAGRLRSIGMDNASKAGVTRRALAWGLMLLLLGGVVWGIVWRPWAEPGGDGGFDTSVPAPALQTKQPRVLFDHGHRNAHSISGRFAPFANLLRADGCRVKSTSKPIDAGELAETDILVIVNAEGPKGRPDGSAFTPGEIDAITSWVGTGGSLLLVADHHPFGAAVSDLARAMGVTMVGGWCDDPANAFPGTADSGAIAFRRERGMLGEHPILAGRNEHERVGLVVTFTGQSLQAPEGAAVLLRCADTAVNQVPVGSKSQTSGGVTTTTFETAESSAAGQAQGIAMLFGKGRIVVLGEAAMLSAQIDVKSHLKFGMNVPGVDNRQFTLNTVRWLARELP